MAIRSILSFPSNARFECYWISYDFFSHSHESSGAMLFGWATISSGVYRNDLMARKINLIGMQTIVECIVFGVKVWYTINPGYNVEERRLKSEIRARKYCKCERVIATGCISILELIKEFIWLMGFIIHIIGTCRIPYNP